MSCFIILLYIIYFTYKKHVFFFARARAIYKTETLQPYFCKNFHKKYQKVAHTYSPKPASTSLILPQKTLSQNPHPAIFASIT